MEQAMDQKHYIMIVEDSVDERDALALLLRAEGYDVVGVGGGREALAYLGQVEPPPCIILLDLMMLGLNGWEFRSAQLRDARLAPIPVLVTSGDGRLREKALALGITEHFEKPIDFDALLTRITRYCPN
jgi:CheY-like chemotaxis protein